MGEVAEILSSADEYLQLREMQVVQPFTLREVSEVIMREEALKGVREYKLLGLITVGEVLSFALEEPAAVFMDAEIGQPMTLGQVLDAIHAGEMAEAAYDTEVNPPVTVGTVVDFLQSNEMLADQRDFTITLKTTVGNMLDLLGEENVKEFVEINTAQAARLDDYEKSRENTLGNWRMLGIFILVFAVLATVTLELINRDKR